MKKKQQALAILQLAPREELTKVHNAFRNVFWKYYFDLYEDFEISLPAPPREKSFFALELGEIDLDRDEPETIDLAKEMEQELGGIPCSTLIFEVAKVLWNSPNTPPQTLEVEAIAIR